MSLYRRVSIRIWGDEKFTALSRPRPNAQTLLLYLITGPHTGQIPGLFTVGEAALSEALGWSLGAFRKCFTELASLGMALADWKARLVYLPNARKHNYPRNAETVKGWRTTFNDLPDCALRDAAFADFREYLCAADDHGQPRFKPEFIAPFLDPLTKRLTAGLADRLTSRQTLPSSSSSSSTSTRREEKSSSTSTVNGHGADASSLTSSHRPQPTAQQQLAALAQREGLTPDELKAQADALAKATAEAMKLGRRKP